MSFIMFYQVAVCDLMYISLNIAVCWGSAVFRSLQASFCLSVLYPHHLPSIRRELFISPSLVHQLKWLKIKVSVTATAVSMCIYSVNLN